MGIEVSSETQPGDILGDYKETVLGMIPKYWNLTKLGDHVEDLIVPMRDKPKQFRGQIPWCRIDDINGKYLCTSKNGYFVDKDTISKMNLKVFPKGTVICSCSANLGICAIAENPLITNQTFIGIVPKNTFDTEFLYYLMISYAKRLQLLSTGTTISYLPKDKFENFIVVKPPLNEQRKIAAILSAVDAAIEQTDAIITQTERMKKGLMQELLTKGIKHTVFKKTSIGRIPEKWDVIYLGNNNYFDLVTGGTPSTKNKRYWENGDIPWLLSGEIHKKRVYNTQKKISKLGYENSNATLLPKQSVLIALAGQGKTRGTTAITEIELTTNQSVAAIVSNFNYLNPYYVFYILDSMYEELRSKSSGSGRAGLSLNILREIGLPLPSLSEQNQIASTLLSVDDKLIIEKNRRIQLGRLKKGLMQDLLTGRVRVKVEDDHA
ncbi:MAG: restriction endonuclease subunit S [Euryarchaeota archaeon]|nr:restriction endonuclease subunit S [Euryarchaeota archaeon]